MKRKAAVAVESVRRPRKRVPDANDELDVYLRVRARFALADLRLYEISRNFAGLSTLLQLRSTLADGLCGDDISVPTHDAVMSAVSEWTTSRELARRVWKSLSNRAKAKYHSTPIGEGTVH
jgi:hypothetical protein